jgi:hypothetical protein
MHCIHSIVFDSDIYDTINLMAIRVDIIDKGIH